jgi:hypothetical protein
MVPLLSLWLPILLSAVLVFIASSIMHMVLTYHRSDFKKLPSQDEAMEALRKFAIPPGEYMLPCGEGPQSMKDPAFVEKMNQGPVAVMIVMKSGPPRMGASLLQWFLFCVVVSVFAAYVAGRAVGPGAPYLQVFRFAGVTAFIAYAVALWQSSIWYKRPWSTTLKLTFDGFVFSLLTAGAFGWLWPR